MRLLKIKIYSREECHLCEEAKNILVRFAARYPLEIEEIDIDKDANASEKYRHEIPVIFLENRKLFKYKIDEEKLRKAIEAAQLKS